MYDEKYYKKHQDGSYRSALRLLQFIYGLTHFRTMVDYGCGIGTWGIAAKELGITDYLGIDQHTYDATYMLMDRSEYLQKDLRVPMDLHFCYDLAVCVEVAEHISEEHVDKLIENICCSSKVVLFSAALSYQGGTGHINEQPCSYWAKKFQKKGYSPVDCIRPVFWEDEQIEIWYRNNCVLYMTPDAFKQFENNLPKMSFPIDIVHPQMLERILRKRGLQ